MVENKKNVFDEYGGSVEQEIKAYPIEKLDLLTTSSSSGSKVYTRCTENIFRILQGHPDFKDRFRYDEWTQKSEIKKSNRWVELKDSDFVPIQRQISTMYVQFRTVSKDMAIDAVHEACRANSFDRAVQYVKSVQYDGKKRLDTWLRMVYGVEDNAYYRAVGANFFKGMVKRILHPGCKFDTVLILEGGQGCGKSTSMSIIAGSWHLETTIRADTKDFFLQFNGKLIVEFSEGETLSRTETKNMKAMISTRVDTYRAPYGRLMQDVPRRCVFAMTTNQSEYLKDETGNRRFFPVCVENDKVNLKWLKENRDQLFAEAVYRVEKLKESVYEYPKEAEDYQMDKMVRSPYEDAIEKWIEVPFIGGVAANNINEQGLTTLDIWMHALMGERNKMRKAEEMQVALALRQLGFERKRKMIDGVQKMRWFKK